MKTAKEWVTVLLAALLLAAPTLYSQKQDKGDKGPGTTRLSIEVTAGEQNKPVENASVYVKFQDPKTHKMISLDLKTSTSGRTHSPDIPAGKVLVQVIATGWKLYGKWYEVDPGDQDVKIHLEKPPKWY